MAAGINKQYLMLDGVPIVGRTIRVFEALPAVSAIYVITPEQEIPYCRENVVEKYGFAKVVNIVPGGAERQHSVLNGIRAIAGVACDDDVVLIHDGVRPFIPPQAIVEAIEVAAGCGGALVAVPAKDTIKVVEGGVIRTTPPRESLWLAQTPQAFRYSVIRDAHERAAAEGFLGTDDASLVERMGGEVRVVMGDYRNIKITTPEDLVLAEAFLRSVISEA